MKWLKHMTATWNDEKVARLVKSGGVEGLAAYGIWWRVVEIVADQMDNKTRNCSVTYDVSRWSLLLSLRGSHVRHWLEKLALTTLVTTEWSGTECKVTIPNLLKYRDEYSKKSGQSRNKEGEQNTTEGEHNTLHCGEEKNPVDPVKEKTASPVEELAAELAGKIFERHPKPHKNLSRKNTEKELLKIARGTVGGLEAKLSALSAVNSMHAAYCECSQWKKDGGEFSKGLRNWFSEGLYSVDPPPENQQLTNMQWKLNGSGSLFPPPDRIVKRNENNLLTKMLLGQIPEGEN